MTGLDVQEQLQMAPCQPAVEWPLLESLGHRPESHQHLKGCPSLDMMDMDHEMVDSDRNHMGIIWELYMGQLWMKTFSLQGNFARAGANSLPQ